MSCNLDRPLLDLLSDAGLGGPDGWAVRNTLAYHHIFNMHDLIEQGESALAYMREDQRHALAAKSAGEAYEPHIVLVVQQRKLQLLLAALRSRATQLLLADLNSRTTPLLLISTSADPAASHARSAHASTHEDGRLGGLLQQLRLVQNDFH